MLGTSYPAFELSWSIYMQISSKRNSDLVRVNGGWRYLGFELTGLYCTFKRLLHVGQLPESVVSSVDMLT